MREFDLDRAMWTVPAPTAFACRACKSLMKAGGVSSLPLRQEFRTAVCPATVGRPAPHANYIPTRASSATHLSVSVAADSYNQKLSERRAEAIKGYLVDHFHLPSENLVTVSEDPRRPVRPGKSAR